MTRATTGTARRTRKVRAVHPRPGYDRLWNWFGLSYASFLVVPRVLMHEMPDGWQDRMAALLEEYDAAFPNQPDGGTRVQRTDSSGKLSRWEPWLLQYRHPDHDAINRMRAGGAS